MKKVKMINGFKVIEIEKEVDEKTLEENRRKALQELYDIFYNKDTENSIK
ncbi:hypothetical protein [Inconstantimicrobium mannanitabidum]|uniref:Uncharacterized protein n=1 Tax=Inconstantimicrobium mannanitabidum TaxID=1604901 RepID=A0ACB5R984_9CLOT|nr:hypothetical protein [Clostridium sp. TW13]GKX65665.1 hypothetical protein rsdtw13_09230 [Clostridium sp. TW13]